MMRIMYKDTVAVYTLAYNAEDTLSRCVDSVLNQTHSNIVYYLLDNGSTDRTREMIKEYAARDLRIRPMFYDYNSRERIFEVLNVLNAFCDVDYLAVLDSDDEYLPQFLENMLRFMYENSLEYAVCGYDTIDEASGKLISRKQLDSNIIIEEKDKANQYTLYRRYQIDMWGRIYAISLHRKAWHRIFAAESFQSKYLYSEIINHEVIKHASRFGILSESLHKYYVRADSQSNTFNAKHIRGSEILYETSREFLLRHGDISKLNQDYLAAIYFSRIEKEFRNLCKSDLPNLEKIAYIDEILGGEVFRQVFDESYKPDPSFENLKNKDEFVKAIYQARDEYLSL